MARAQTNRFVDGYIRVLDKVSDWSALFAGACVIGILVLTCVEVFVRSVLGISTLVADEFGGYLNAVLLFMALGHTLKEGAFIRVDALFVRMPQQARQIAIWFILLLSLIYTIVVAYFLGNYVLYSFLTDERSTQISRTPVWIPQGFIWLGVTVLGLRLFGYVLNRARNVP